MEVLQWWGLEGVEGGGMDFNREKGKRLLGYRQLSIITHFKKHDIFHY